MRAPNTSPACATAPARTSASRWSPNRSGTPRTPRKPCACFEQLRAEEPAQGLVDAHLGIAYDTCHFALQYEEAHEAIARLNAGGAPVLKFHLSSALKLKPTEVALARLAKMHEPTYLHQTMGRAKDGSIVRFKDIPFAMAAINQLRALEELRVHFHVPGERRSPLRRTFHDQRPPQGRARCHCESAWRLPRA
ncbi:hypothetical protein EMGBD4_05990 [Verrucomicrobiota bacterium]|nr:hypothetical protein EMGBD4_05990 [Verrucomicrobiota bacterium]